MLECNQYKELSLTLNEIYVRWTVKAFNMTSEDESSTSILRETGGR